MHKETENFVRETAKNYISRTFKIPINDIDWNDEFGVQIKAKPNGFGEDEYDDFVFDVTTLVDDKTLEEIYSKKIPMNTVGDFCNLVLSLYESNISRRIVRTVFGIGKRRLSLFHLRRILKKGTARKFFYIIKKRIYSS